MTEDALFIPDKVSEYFEMSEKQPFIIKVKGKNTIYIRLAD